MDEGLLYSIAGGTIVGLLTRHARRRRTRRRAPPDVEPMKPHLDEPMKPLTELRKATGASLVDCRKALDATEGDVSAARSWLRNLGVERVLAGAECDRPDAEAGFAKYGWNLDQSTNYARQAWLHRHPEDAESEAASIRRERLDAAENLADVLSALDSSDGPEAVALVETLEEYESAAEGDPDALFHDRFFEVAAQALDAVSASELACELRRAAASQDPGAAFDESHFRGLKADLLARVRAYLERPTPI